MAWLLNAYKPFPSTPEQRPTDITLSNTSVADNASLGTIVGSIGVVDADGFNGTLDFAAPNFDAGGLFEIVNGNLVVNAALPVGASTQNITISATEGETTITRNFAITVVDHAAGQIVTTFSLVNTAGANQTNVPFEFGLPLPRSVLDGTSKIALYDGDTPLSIQEDNRSTDADGHVRFCKVTGLYPSLASGATKTITVKTEQGSPATNTPIAISDIAATDYNATVTLTLPDGTTYVADALSALQSASAWGVNNKFFHGKFRSGPICTEFVASAPFVAGGTTPHTHLRCFFHIAAYKTQAGAVGAGNPIVAIRTDVIIENGYKLVPGLDDQVYDLVIKSGKANPATVYELTGGAGDVALTLSSTKGLGINITRASGNWALSATPNASDCGKAIVEIGGNGRAAITSVNQSGSTQASCTVPVDRAFPSTSLTAGQWKKMGVYHYASTRLDTRLWWGAEPRANAVLTTSYLKSTEMFLNYAANATSASIDESVITKDGGHPFGMNVTTSGSIKGYITWEPSTGDVDHIGVLPYTQNVCLLHWDLNHAVARRTALAQGRSRQVIPVWIRNEEDGGLFDFSSSGVFSSPETAGTPNDLKLAWYREGTRWFTFALNHSGGTSYMPYLLTGDLLYLEGLVMQATHTNTVTSSDYGIVKVYNATLTGTNYRWACAGHPFTTGDAIRMHIGGFFPAIGGVNIQRQNVFYVRVVDADTVDIYDSRGAALAGGASGRVAFSSGGTNISFVNGKNKNPVYEPAHSGQPRQIAWMLRTFGHAAICLPDNLPPGILGSQNKKLDAQLAFNEAAKYVKTTYVDNPNYVPFGPRFFGQQNGDYVFGPWQMDYCRVATLNLLEMGVQSLASSDLQALVDWLAEEPIQRATNTNICPSFMVGDYYTRNRRYDGVSNPYQYEWAGLYAEVVKRPLPYQGHWQMPGVTADITSVSDPANVTIVLKSGGVEATFFDATSQATLDRHIGSWIFVGSGAGQVKSVLSKGTCVVDTTVYTWDGKIELGKPMVVGNGQTVNLPYPSVGNGEAIVGSARNYGEPGNDRHYITLARSAVEIAKQRNKGVANYSAAIAHFVARGMPANPPTQSEVAINPTLIKGNLVSRT